jgi:hypothetical protein
LFFPFVVERTAKGYRKLLLHRISLALNLTKTKQANIVAALEITSGFKKIVPDDPVKYDFVLTRLGIRDDIVLTLTTSKR